MEEETMRKLVSLLLALIMTLSMAAVAVAEGPVEINIFISQPEYADAVRALIDAYKEVKPEVTINYETTQSDYPTLLKTKINAGECPDIFSTTSGKEIAVYLDRPARRRCHGRRGALRDAQRGRGPRLCP